MQTKNFSWSTKEDLTLSTNYSTSTSERICQLLPRRSLGSIYARANSIGLYKQDKGTSSRNGDLAILLNGDIRSIYWIGYIFADGCLHNHRRLTVCSKDVTQMQKLAHYLGTSVGAVYHPGNPAYGIKEGILSKISISHPKIVRIMEDAWGMHTAKTYNPPSVSILKSQLRTREEFLAFFIGFIDGDGCISTNAKGYTYIILSNHSSWIDVLNFLVEKLKEYGIYTGISTARIDRRGYAKFQISGVSNKIKLETCFSQLPYMERKWN